MALLTTRERFALQKLAAAQPRFMKRAGAEAAAAKEVAPLAERLGRGVTSTLGWLPHHLGKLFWGGVGKATGAGLHAGSAVAEHASRGVVDAALRHPGKALGAAAMLGGTAYHMYGPETGKLHMINELANFGPIAAVDQASTVLNPYGKFSTESGRGLTERTKSILNAPVQVHNPLMERSAPNVVTPQIPGRQ